MNVLVLNAGSSTLKFQLIATDLDRIRRNEDERLCSGSVEDLGKEAELTFRAGKTEHRSKENVPDIHTAIEEVLSRLCSAENRIDVDAVGHRVVHGGEFFSESAFVTDRVLQAIRDCIPLAPLHNPNNIEGILAVRKLFGPTMPQVAVFDTAFHQTLPDHAFLYAVPYELYEKHRIRRYGFHGTSHRYVAHRYRQLRSLTREQTNVITLHLGNGCSAAAIKAGYCVDTSMGLTPLEGLVMGTRSGDVDPSLVTAIAEKAKLTCSEVETMLNSRSGLLGISGISNDMRELQDKVSTDTESRAGLAIEVFCYRARKYVGSFLAAMGGADALIFTGGIGENAPQVRARICQGLQWAGLRIDQERNQNAIRKEGPISTDDSSLAAFCIPTDEELLIARDTARCVLGVPHPS
jgi:acetate kinase